MTGLQALERTAPSQPMTYGIPERIESEYTRHGTLTLIGNFSVTTGELIARRSARRGRSWISSNTSADGGDRPGGGVDLRGG